MKTKGSIEKWKTNYTMIGYGGKMLKANGDKKKTTEYLTRTE